MYGQGGFPQAPGQGMPGMMPGGMQQGPRPGGGFPGQMQPGAPQMQQQQHMQPQQPFGQMQAPGSMMPGARPAFGGPQGGMQPGGGAPQSAGAPFGQQQPRPMMGGTAAGPGQPFGAPQQQPQGFPGGGFPGTGGGMPQQPGSVRPGMPGGPMGMGGPAPGGFPGQAQAQQQQGMPGQMGGPRPGFPGQPGMAQPGMPGPAPMSGRGPTAGAGAFPGQPQGQMQGPGQQQPFGQQQQQPAGAPSSMGGPRPGMAMPGPFGAGPAGPGAPASAAGPFGPGGPAGGPRPGMAGPPAGMGGAMGGPGQPQGGPAAGPGPAPQSMAGGPRPNPFAGPFGGQQQAGPAPGAAGGPPAGMQHQQQQPGAFPPAGMAGGPRPGMAGPPATGGAPGAPGPFGPGPFGGQQGGGPAPGQGMPPAGGPGAPPGSMGAQNPFAGGGAGRGPAQGQGQGMPPGPFGAGPSGPQQGQADMHHQQAQPQQQQQQAQAMPGRGPLPASSMMGPTAPPTMGGPGHGPGGPGGPGAGAVAMAEVNEGMCCSPAYMAMTVNAMPVDATVLAKTSLPFGLCVHPMSEGEGTLRGGIPVVNFGQAGVVRCKKCRAYVNPFVAFLDGGRRWRCNFCHFVNDVPPAYFAPTDEAGNRVDRMQRPELCTGSVEFVAPVEYMVRPPQPPVYVFVLDVSFSAVSTGVLQAACATIRSVLDKLPGQDRVQVGFVTYDTTVHFYSLKAPGAGKAGGDKAGGAGAAGGAAPVFKPQQLVVSDIDDLFLPVPGDLLVNLSEARGAVDSLLASMPATFASTRVMDSCLGAALEGAFQVMQHIGGKMVVVQACLPTVGPGKLKPREAPRMLGGDQEHTLLAPASTDDGGVYKTKAIDFSKQQVSVDMFLFNHAYADVATLGALSRYTAGQVYFYPSYTATADGGRFSTDLARDLTRNTGFEAVMRIRASKGMNISNFYGNFFIRGQDLLALPNVTPETAFNVELTHEEPLQPGSVIAVQAALLYTTSSGERRICVHTLAKPVTQLSTDLFNRANVDAVANMMAKVALDHELRMGVAAARRYLHKQLLDICRAYRAATTAPYGGVMGMGMGMAAGPGGMGSRMPMAHTAGPNAPGSQGAPAGDITSLLPESLQMLPLYIMGLQKSGLFRGGDQIRSDERSALVYRCLSMPVTHSRHYVYPRLYSLHDLEPTAGRPDAAAEANQATAGQGRVTLPPVHTLSASVLNPAGCYLLDNGVEQYVWLGREVPGGLLQALFGFESLAGVDCASLQLVPQGNDYSARVCGIAHTLSIEAYARPKIRVVREGAASGAGGGGVDGHNEQRFHWHLIEDRQAFPGGSVTYAEYVQIVVKEAAMVSMGGAAPGAGH